MLAKTEATTKIFLALWQVAPTIIMPSHGGWVGGRGWSLSWNLVSFGGDLSLGLRGAAFQVAPAMAAAAGRRDGKPTSGSLSRNVSLLVLHTLADTCLAVLSKSHE